MSDALRHWTPPSWINSHLARVGGIGGALVSGILTSTSFPGYMNIIHLFSWGVWFVSLFALLLFNLLFLKVWNLPLHHLRDWDCPHQVLPQTSIWEGTICIVPSLFPDHLLLFSSLCHFKPNPNHEVFQ